MWLRMGSSCSCLEYSNEIMGYIQCRWYLQLLDCTLEDSSLLQM